ncbi:MAG: hypothetical protein WC966_12545 [Bradymonadales bacterium]
MRQGSDLEVVTAPNDEVDDEIGQNGKENWEVSPYARASSQNSGVSRI